MFFKPSVSNDLSRHDQYVLTFSGYIVTLLAVLITVLGGMYAYRAQWETARHDRAIAEAHKVADDLTITLLEGMAQLKKLQGAAVSKMSWYDFSTGPYREFLSYKEGWRRDLIVMHYKVQRYFGEDMARTLVDAEKLISGDRYDGLHVASPCPSIPKEYDSYYVAAESIECSIRFTAYSHKELMKDSDDFLSSVGQHWERSRNIDRNLEIYDRRVVIFIRAMNSRLTSLGEISVQPVFE
ncbi:hypothetical protein [Pseudomonas sp. R2-7-07]|uniref:hypothetical protein n=1 Tax=Pseudomonas sp. R2-7-07 TaxID=658641 RepID=UPI000F5805A6|nr:hypothetical protein [Pseudomonas sp. R2-7-07]AZF46769.1 hypothetical protein C4J86_1520 [Pseudomonas sp. R2-7-07]